jgi:hypothetical protein
MIEALIEAYQQQNDRISQLQILSLFASFKYFKRKIISNIIHSYQEQSTLVFVIF